MTITKKKLAYATILAIIMFVFYSLYWVIFTPPDTMVDCKIGKITAVVTHQDCQKLIIYARAKK